MVLLQIWWTSRLNERVNWISLANRLVLRLYVEKSTKPLITAIPRYLCVHRLHSFKSMLLFQFAAARLQTVKVRVWKTARLVHMRENLWNTEFSASDGDLVSYWSENCLRMGRDTHLARIGPPCFRSRDVRLSSSTLKTSSVIFTINNNARRLATYMYVCMYIYSYI